MIKPAQIEWSDGTPVSSEFDDVYFSKASGIDETRYVFLQQNQLSDRWNHWLSKYQDSQSAFTVVETGFGTGLNFLCAWQLWNECRSAQNVVDSKKTLHFVSVEKFPLQKDSLTEALKQWPELEYLSTQLLDKYPPLVNGWHRIEFPKGNLVLHLFLGDIKDWLPNIEADVDAWFLDGFAPSKNPEMWDETLFTNMSRLTKAGGTVATFTCAGIVKRGLKGAGFEIHKVKGFGRKREMLIGSQSLANGAKRPRWLRSQPWLMQPKVEFSDKTATVIGGGVAGCSTAYALANRGWQVTLIEQKPSIADCGSGNPQGVLYAKLSSDMNPHSQFYLNGYLHSLNVLKQAMPDKQHWQDTGVLQLAFSEKEAKRQKEFNNKHALDEVVRYVTPEEASQIAGTPIEQSGLFFKNGAWVSPKHWCEALCQHKNIQVCTSESVTDIEQVESHQWSITTNKQTIESSVVVVTAAQHSKDLTQLSFLPTKSIPGQVTQAQCDEKSIQLNAVLCGSSYVAPQHNGKLVFGASYRLKSVDENVYEEDNTDNLENLRKDFPSVGNQIENEPLLGRASTRCAVPDYTPIVGPVLKAEQFLNEFSDLSKSKNWKFQQPAMFHQGLYVNCGHGSRGLSSAPLCSEIIAAQINGEPLPIQKNLADILSPSRFLVKQLIG